ncbi:helix-turn-helix domain-containing protein [Streptomyces collinus]
MSAPSGGGGGVRCAHRGVGAGIPGDGTARPRGRRSGHVYVNAVRYRLRRFEELTGTSLDAPDTAVELSWAVAARELGTPPRGPAPAGFQ